MLNSPEVIVPIMTFILGWGSGVITAWNMYRDHTRRLDTLEGLIKTTAEHVESNTRAIAVLESQMARG